MTTVQWNADDYARHSRGQFGWALSVIERLNVAPDVRVLDIGCGDGKVTVELARRVPRGSVVGVDSSPAMIDLARRSYGNAAANVDFRLGDAQALDFGARFDLAFSNAALHWARDQPAVLRGVAAALVPGCRIFFFDGRARHCGGGLPGCDRGEDDQVLMRMVNLEVEATKPG